MTHCSAGREITGFTSDCSPELGQDWRTPCPVPAEIIVGLEPPVSLCSPHYAVFVDVLLPVLRWAGLVDEAAVRQRDDGFEQLMAQQGLLLDDEGQ